jgi:hypothetical protein
MWSRAGISTKFTTVKTHGARMLINWFGLFCFVFVWFGVGGR